MINLENLIEMFYETEWRRSHGVACYGMDTNYFFPSDVTGVNQAKKICAACPVRGLCLEIAVRNEEEHGVWGGTSERERAILIKKRRQMAVKATSR